MTQENNAAVAVQLPESVFRRNDTVQKINVMDTINSVKTYNPQPWKAEDADLAWNLMIKNYDTEWMYKKFTSNVKINLLKVRKGINGMFNILDDNGNVQMDATWNAKKWFAYTEEYGRYSRNDLEIMFKAPDIKWYSRVQLWEFKNLIREPLINWRKNPFHKVALDINSIPYNASHLSESYIIYWVFKSWEHAWEYFRMFISSSAFGQVWDAKTKTSSIVAWSLADAIQKVQNDFNAIKLQLPPWASFDDSLINVDLSVAKSGNFYKPEFKNPTMIVEDNSQDLQAIEELLSQYKVQEFSWIAEQNVANRIGADTNTLQQDVSQVKQWYYQPSQTVEVEAEVVNEEPKKESKLSQLNNQNESISISDIPF